MRELLRDQSRIASAASAYDLASPVERERSARDLAELFLSLQQSERVTAFVEVGAHEAWFSREMAVRRPGARIVAFEGSPYNHAHFSAQIDFAGLGVDYRHALVCEVDGVGEMLIQAARDGAPLAPVKGNDSMLRRHEAGVAYEVRAAPSVRLDTAFADAERDGLIFGLWIDVEGAQRRVLEGAERTLARTRSLFIEVEDVERWQGQWLFDDVQAHLATAGFVALARDFERRHQFNVVFIRAELRDDPAVRGVLDLHASRIDRRP